MTGTPTYPGVWERVSITNDSWETDHEICRSRSPVITHRHRHAGVIVNTRGLLGMLFLYLLHICPITMAFPGEVGKVEGGRSYIPPGWKVGRYKV